MSDKTHALALISQYSSEESDSEEGVSTASIKVLDRLPVPEVLRSLFDNGKNIDDGADDPALHGGRTRSFPHVRGNWATYVFIPYTCNDGILSLLKFAFDTCKSVADLKQIEEPHVSLTRTVALQYHWIEPFVSDLKSHFCQIKSFPISFSSFEIYSNDEKTRTFLSLQLFDGREKLLDCVKSVDKYLSAFKLPAFYEDASFHMSIAWCVGDKVAELKTKLPELNVELQTILAKEPDHFETLVKTVLCKSGNKLFEFKLL